MYFRLTLAQTMTIEIKTLFEKKGELAHRFDAN